MKSALFTCCFIQIKYSWPLFLGAEPQYKDLALVYSTLTVMHACNKRRTTPLLWLRTQGAQQILAHAHLKEAKEFSKDLLAMNGTLIPLFIHFTLRKQSATSFSYQSVQVYKWPGTSTVSVILGQQEDEAFWGRFLKCRRLPR